jgi:catechol 2,3-dioxygenase-like lactoylglutathione lyase family enzyme
MNSMPTRAIPVQELSQSLDFYVERLGLKLIERYPDAAHLQTPFGHILLAGPGAGDLAPYMAPIYETVKPGAVLYLFAPDIEAMAQRLPETSIIRTDWGERRLELPDPNGYSISFWTENDLTPTQMLELFGSVPDRMERALDGLGEAQLDLVRAPGKWSIRLIVHHVADSAIDSLSRLRYAVAEPGRLFHANPYSPDSSAAGLCSGRRPVGPSVALLRAVHEHMLQLVEHVPGALEAYTVNEAGTKAAVGRTMGMLAAHAAGHVDQIWQTRRVHGLMPD